MMPFRLRRRSPLGEPPSAAMVAVERASRRRPTAFNAPQLTTIAIFVVAIGILYFGREVLVPLALSILLSFLLAPAVRQLERARFPRVVATSVVVGLACCVVAGVFWVAISQLLNFAASLPEYKSNIQTKISALRSGSSSSLVKAKQTIEELGAEIAAKSEPSSTPTASARASRAGSAKLTPAGDAAKPVPVVVEEALSPIDVIRDYLGPVVVPLTTAGAVILFTFIMLLRREDLRDRVIRLVGHGQINLTTQVLEEAAGRVGRYLRAQLIVNVLYGLPVGIALFLIGVPNAALWGLLATVLRFIPYVGAWIAAALPIAIAFAISDGWSLVVWTVATFVILELISNNIVEPWIYGASTGMSSIAVVAAAIFWTWLWGAIGLLLAVPLTVCLVVMGRYLPQFSFLSILLGDEPVLPLEERMYQRLLAQDQEEAAELAEEYIKEFGCDALYENVLIPVLNMVERDRHDDTLADDRSEQVVRTLRELVDELSECPEPLADGTSVPMGNPAAASIICIVPARDEADELVGTMLARSLGMRRIAAEVISTEQLRSEVLDRVVALKPKAVLVSALPPAAVLHASFFCKRLKALMPDLKLVVALWHPQGAPDKSRDRLIAAGATTVVTTLQAAIESLATAAYPAVPPAPVTADDATTQPVSS